MNKDDLVRDVFRVINEIPNNSEAYISGILLKDNKIQMHMVKLAYLQAIIMQSLQANNKKRAIRYALAFCVLSKNNALDETIIRESFTTKLLTGGLYA